MRTLFLSVQCDLAEAVHQLISNHSTHGEDETTETISVSQFTAVAAGCVLYLSSPGPVCTAVRQGSWGEEVRRFLEEITHQESHQDQDHEHIHVHGLKVLLQGLHDHYEPSDREVTKYLDHIHNTKNPQILAFFLSNTEVLLYIYTSKTSELHPAAVLH